MTSVSGHDALAVVEISTIARGYVVLDALVKKAPVTVRVARAVTPGKLVIVFSGDVASVEEAFEAAREHAKGTIVDDVLLPAAHAGLLPAIDGALVPASGDAIGVVETSTVASSVRAADAALKAALVVVPKARLAIGIGGKGVFVVCGALADVEAAVDAATAEIPVEKRVAIEIIAQPHDEVRGFLLS